VSKDFHVAVIAILVAFCAYEVWLNLHLRALHDDAVRACAREQEVRDVVEGVLINL
jgi:hypothetical protein